jgi:hypothetical protein
LKRNFEETEMTDEQILKLAENHLIFEKWDDNWKTDTIQLLKFARTIYIESFKEGYDVGYDHRNEE